MSYSNFQVRTWTPEEDKALDFCAAGYKLWVDKKDRTANLKYLNCRSQFPGLPPCKECLAESKRPSATHDDVLF